MRPFLDMIHHIFRLYSVTCRFFWLSYFWTRKPGMWPDMFFVIVLTKTNHNFKDFAPPLRNQKHIFWCHSVRNSTDLRRSPLEGLPPFAIMWFIISLLYSSSKPGQKQSDKVGQTDEITLKFCAPSPIRTCPVPSLVCVSSNKNIHNLTHT